MELSLELSQVLGYKDTQPYNTAPYNGAPQLTWELHEAIMFGLQTCPGCDGEKRIYNKPAPPPANVEPEIVDGVTINGACVEFPEKSKPRKTHRGVGIPCICTMMDFKLKTLRRILPLKYIASNLATWIPSTRSRMSLEKQQKIFDFVSQNPGKGYLFYGASGCGKTTMATALIRTAMENQWFDSFWRIGGNIPGQVTWQGMWVKYVNWDELVGEYMEEQNYKGEDEAPTPSVTTKLIAKHAALKHRPVICIEEIDKSRLTLYKANLLFKLVRAIEDACGQLILTSNLGSESTIEEFFCNNPDDGVNTAGKPIWRRIQDNCKMIRFED